MPALASGRPVEPEFGILLRRARRHRGLSQLGLATRGEVSQRHVSFLESGRARPSQDMVARLAECLDLPLRLRNDMMVSAGFAPAYPNRSLGDPDLAPVSGVLDFLLARAEPYPAIVMDRHYTVLRANKAAGRFAAALTDGAIAALPEGINLVELMLSPHGVWRHLVNGRVIAAHLLARLQPELPLSSPNGQAAKLAAMLSDAISLETSQDDGDLSAPDWRDGQADPVVVMHLRKQGRDLRLFSALSTFGTARDVTVQDLYLEHYFAADAATEEWISSL